MFSETNVPDDEIVETIAKRPCLEQSDNDDNDEVDPVPLIKYAEAKLQILDCNAILLNRDMTMPHILC